METGNMTRHVLVLRGRLGKTAFAESLALRSGSTPAYLATAEVLDGEMRDHVTSHQASRAGQFATIEEPLTLSKTLIKTAKTHDVIHGRLSNAVDHQSADFR